MKKPILSATQDYTFSDFFNMPYSTEDIIKEFGYDFAFELLELPQEVMDKEVIKVFQKELTRKMPKLSLNSEMAKREFLIAPILLQLLNFIDVRISVEYPLEVERNLKGTLDYLIKSNTKLTVIEAKKADLDKGFTQLAVELIALEKYEEDNYEVLFGAVTTGDLWKFGKLDNKMKKIIKDINTYRIPADTADIFSFLVGILR